MNIGKIETFQEVLETLSSRSSREWVYLPLEGQWDLTSASATLESEEVPPEMEDDPDAGVPQFAIDHRLKQAVPVTTLQDIVANALDQKPDAKLEELLAAFLYFYKHDAFMEI